MWKVLRVLTISLCLIGFARPGVGQTATPSPQATSSSPAPSEFSWNCAKEKDPFFSYCEDARNLMTKVSTAKKAGVTDLMSDDGVRGSLREFLGAGSSSPDRFTSLQTDIALQNALGTISSGLNQNRPDQQTSAGSSASGTTGLVEKAGSAAILAFALESGALTRSVSGNTATLSGNADGLVRALTGQQILCFVCQDLRATPVLKNINLSAAFLLNQQSSNSTNTSGPANSATPTSVTSVVIPSSVGKLSSLSVRYTVWNPYDPHSSKFLDGWKTAKAKAKSQINDRAKSLQASLQPLVTTAAVKSDLDALAAKYQPIFLADANAGDMPGLRKHFLALYAETVGVWTRDDPQFNDHVASVNLSLAQYRALWQQLLDDAKDKPLLTFQYTFNKPQSQPETHDLSLILGYTPKSAVGLLSVNAAVSIYGGAIPVGAKYGRLHDGQISAEYDRPISIKSNPNQLTFSLAGYWQYQPSPSVLNITSGNLVPGTNIDLPQNAQVLLGTSGSLWVTQAKFTINGKSGIKVPFAVKWANKTDLLSGNKLGAQVGISYDFSSLSSFFGGSSQ